jgi:hypothetical protein
MSKPTITSFIAPGDDFANNALFEGRRVGSGAHSPNVHWLDCYAPLRRLAAERNIIMNTSDMVPPEEADIVVYMMQPSPERIRAFKRANPGIKVILILLETSLGAAYAFNPRNHEDADAVLTYKPSLVDHIKYFPMRPHAYDPARIRTGKPFSQRKTGCLVASNQKYRFRSGLMAQRSGWHFTWSDRLDYMLCLGELITYRSKVGRLCARYPAGTFDIYGEGWDMHHETKGRCLGIPKVSTLDYIGDYRYYFALENHRGKESLISERIWDALWGDAVPVYCGNPNIATIVPKECFINADDFASPAEMLEYLVRTPESEWDRVHRAGREFLHSRATEPYLPEACAEELLQPFLALAGC